MTVSKDQKITRFGTPTGHEPLNLGLQAGVTVYRGTIALTNGTGGSKGMLKNADTPAASDICWGLLEAYGPGSDQIDSGFGMVGGATDGAVTCDVVTGAFFLGSSSGGDLLGVTTLGQVVYVYDSVTVAATNGGSSRPQAGVHVYTDPLGLEPGGFAIRLGSNQSTGA